MRAYHGDLRAGQTVRLRFNTVNASGVPTTLTNGAVIITKDGADATPAGGVTLTVDMGGVVGLHRLVIDTTADPTTFSAGSDYSVRLGGTSNVGGTSVVGIVVGSFSVQNRSIATDASGRVTAGTVADKAGYSAAATNLPAKYPATLAAADVSGNLPVDKTGYALTTGERSAIATEVESHLLNEGDSQMLINAIVGAIGNSNVDQAVLVAAIRSDLERSGGNLNTLVGRLTSGRASNLDFLDASVNSRLATSGYTAPSTPPTASAIATASAAAILATPNNKLATDASGFVTATNGGGGGGGSGPTAIQIRQEMDANSTRLAYLTGPVPTRSEFSTQAEALAAISAAPVTLANGSVTSAKFAAIEPGKVGLLERLMLLVARFYPVPGGSVTAPKSGNGQIVTKGAGGATIASQPVTDNGTTQTLGPPA